LTEPNLGDAYELTDHRLATEDEMRALRGEVEPPVVLDKRLGLALDLVSGRVVCARCGMDGLDLFRSIVLPHPLGPDMIIAGLRCRSCKAEQAVTLEQQGGAVVLGTSLPRS
jgi:hypothetical protein